jgi:hypothetical protein
MTSAAGGTPEQRELQAKILAERDKGNVVFWGLPGELMTMPIEQIVKQDANGLLYDLNRLEEISLTFLADPKWVNDFAVALVIRKLIEQRDALASRQPVSQGDGWQDIASAPKDGTRIIVVGEHGNVWCDVSWKKMTRVPDRWESFLGALPFKPVKWHKIPSPPKAEA